MLGGCWREPFQAKYAGSFDAVSTRWNTELCKQMLTVIASKDNTLIMRMSLCSVVRFSACMVILMLVHVTINRFLAMLKAMQIALYNGVGEGVNRYCGWQY